MNNASRKPSGWLWPALFLALVALAATTNRSLWIDECVTAHVAHPWNLIESWREVVRLRWAEVQMPLFVAYMWAAEKIIGDSEIALRLASLPVFLAGMTLLITVWSRRGAGRWTLALVIGLSPFVWYYLNEARLYTMQLGATALIVAALTRLGDPAPLTDRAERCWLGVYLAGVVLLSAISMLGEIWASAALLAVFVVVPKERWLSWLCGHRSSLLVAAAALLAVGFYYVWSLKAGARATQVGTTNLQTMLFIVYEQLGFTGLGPGRLELRDAGARALKAFAPGLAAYAVVVGLVLLVGVRELWQPTSRRKLAGLAGSLLLPAALILAAGLVTHFRVLGRHFAPLVVISFLILSAGLTRLWRRGWLGKSVVFGFVLVTLASCLAIRLAPRHEKDDYRQAAVLAKAALARNELVWWNAADMGAIYYDVPIATGATKLGAALFLMNPEPGFAMGVEKPALVVASKPDVYDGQGAMAAFLKDNGYRLVATPMAFTIWRRE